MVPPANLVESLRAALADRKDVRLAFLFGSQARGRARPVQAVGLAREVSAWVSSRS